MLRMLSKDEIHSQWEFISKTIKESLQSDANMEQVYNNLMIGTMQCWASYKDVIRNDTLSSIGTTTFVHDLCSGEKMLLGYSLYSTGDGITDKELEEGYPVLVEFALKHGCKKICAYTKVPRVYEMAKLFGADVKVFITSPPLLDNPIEVKEE